MIHLTFYTGYVLGFIGGACISMSYNMYRATKKLKLKTAELTADEAALRKRMTEVRDKLMKVKELTDEQLNLASHVEAPSKNALHSRHKNSLNHRIQLLEEEKKLILVSIIHDGYDPVITILNKEGERENLKLSEYLIRAGVNFNKTKESNIEEDGLNGLNGNPKKVGKFIVYTGGNDGTTH